MSSDVSEKLRWLTWYPFVPKGRGPSDVCIVNLTLSTLLVRSSWNLVSVSLIVNPSELVSHRSVGADEVCHSQEAQMSMHLI
jgi:hypothetical protein